MTKLLEEALARLARLPEREQDALASIILEELASEQRWDLAFAGAPDQLARLADEALAEHESRRTEPLDLGDR